MASLPMVFETDLLRVNALPVPPTALLGREQEVILLSGLLASGAVRLLTLTGPGGVGKTRLAVAVAMSLLDRPEAERPPRTIFVPLAALSAPTQVIPTIERALEMRDDPSATGNPVRNLATSIGEAPLLLILDNMEQVVGAAPDIATLLGACPNLAVLVTSRLALHLRGEREYPVDPLPLPAAGSDTAATVSGSEAVLLFVDTAQRVRPSFALTDANAATVADICRRLDGLPLAIELAAARMKVLSVSALLARLSSRLNVLTDGARDLPDRQHTLRDTIAWSYHLLTSPEQDLFRRISVFAGGASLGAVEAIAGDAAESILDPLTALVDHSLVRQVVRDDEPRLQMLETIREFGRERLAESGNDAAARGAHAAWFLALAGAAEQRLAGSEQSVWLDRLDLEGDNLRAALHWLETRGNPADALRLTTALWRYWEIRGQLREASIRLETALSHAADADPTLRARALNNLGNVLLDLGDHTAAADRYDASLALRQSLADRDGVADTLNNLGLLALAQDDLSTARARHDESLTLRRELGKPWGIALSLSNLGDVANASSDYTRARVLHQEALAIRRGLGEPRAIGYSTNNLGESALGNGDLVQAAESFQAAIGYLHSVGDRGGEAIALHNLGATELRLKRYHIVANSLGRALRLRVEVQDRAGIATTVALLAQLASAVGEPSFVAEIRDYQRLAHGHMGADARVLAMAERANLLSESLGQGGAVAGSGPATPAAPDLLLGLTPREREVIRLVADGRSDREIGDELFITTRTASTHVTNILGKLALPSRTAAAAWAIRHGVQ